MKVARTSIDGRPTFTVTEQHWAYVRTSDDVVVAPSRARLLNVEGLDGPDPSILMSELVSTL